MPPAIYRRHTRDCQFYGRPRRDSRSQRCQCPIWVQGSIGGEYLRRSLDLVSWQAAQDRVRGWEASGEVGIIRADIPSISEAVERFFDDAQARGLAESTIGKWGVLLRKQLLPWCRGKGYLSLKQLTVPWVKTLQDKHCSRRLPTAVRLVRSSRIDSNLFRKERAAR
jgi:hypothetical protein